MKERQPSCWKLNHVSEIKQITVDVEDKTEEIFLNSVETKTKQETNNREKMRETENSTRCQAYTFKFQKENTEKIERRK